ncbi:hypothetical protein DL766_008730 [Monosporascus sp. MC13-8B]|uniref:Cyanovirin-N domain-containing protein n=1 Tax=Monosporascus cannonballus TaxID=155416 RepID=A0ABY0HKE1_9PEZI|nr:hypothetical protein DL762_001608 [Monosporascus cannonballus]RYP00274.1 hypothetical protein DL763_000885 [Monosporascus cannonballus]RYP18185.1 hypothetical protein DL766_008730 [Monosporascus sp. MC13-8B]
MGTIATFLCLLLEAIVANGEYFSHCGRPTLLWHDDAPFLGSLCDGAPKGTQCTALNIGRCYANKGGELAASKHGNYYNTCKDCNKDIENKDGFLTCFDGGEKLCRPEDGGQF